MRKIISTMAILGLSTSVFAHDYKLEPKKINDNTWCFLGKLEAPTKKQWWFYVKSLLCEYWKKLCFNRCRSNL